jgi:hypothetical protein
MSNASALNSFSEEIEKILGVFNINAKIWKNKKHPDNYRDAFKVIYIRLFNH